ncbi:hypothetical protein EIK77_004893 [Talaromyces pinophilus]|nr:hypothetical protein EIK77_004893 [Talaromyces pinophilus]
MSDTSKAQAESTQPTQQKKTPQVLEEDDEFEDFPVEGEIRPCSSVALAASYTGALESSSLLPDTEN